MCLCLGTPFGFWISNTTCRQSLRVFSEISGCAETAQSMRASGLQVGGLRRDTGGEVA